MKKSIIYSALLIGSLCLFGACSDDEQQPLGNPTVEATDATYESLSFSWQPIANAVQYGYRLSDPAGEAVEAGVSQKTSVSFSGLQPATTYTLEVWAFAAMDGDYSTPPAAVLTATTNALVKLGTPDVTVDINGADIKISWEKVENAESYNFSIVDADGNVVKEGGTVKTTYKMSSLVPGEYTLTVEAKTKKGGFENSDPCVKTFTIGLVELWRANGTYSSADLEDSWYATIVAYNDKSYSILAFYGAEGYNLDFTVDTSNKDDMFSFVNGEEVTVKRNKYWRVDTGIEYPEYILSKPWDNNCKFKGTSKSGSVEIAVYIGGNLVEAKDTFVW